MKNTIIASVFALAFVAASTRVMTVTNGTPDGNGHPFVGTVIQFIPNTDLISICSGSALSSTRFLTAAHCADPSAGPVFVSYKNAPPYSLATDFTPGVFVPDPDWCEGCGSGLQGFDSHDVAVVALLSPKPLTTGYAALPAAGLVDTLAMKTGVDLVGYGVQGFLHGGGKPEQVFLFTRYFAPSQLIQSNNKASDEFIKLTANPAAGGGVCFGDSGGPDLLSGTNTVLAVNSFVSNSNCAGVTYSNRVDKADILAFIRGI